MIPRLSGLDFRLGVRRLARYPVLTIVGTIAIAVGIALGAVYFEGVDKFMNPRMRVRDGDRIVSILQWDVKNVEIEVRTLREFASGRSARRAERPDDD